MKKLTTTTSDRLSWKQNQNQNQKRRETTDTESGVVGERERKVMGGPRQNTERHRRRGALLMTACLQQIHHSFIHKINNYFIIIIL